ncbi:MAG: UDP-glucose 4-epimerase GalE [Bacteroidetes bacterium]|nr:UDP-glucose 4-epimerase GalE [Bacteroidota bacterium]
MQKLNTILVTGGAGYIGSHTIIELINEGYTVISADNYSNSSEKTYERIKKITGADVKHYKVDLCDSALTKKIFTENPSITGIIHFAALKSVPESVEQPLLYYRNNVNSLLNILECMKEFHTRDLIFSSSCSVYGNSDKLPVNENTPIGIIESPYGYTKIVGERIIQDFLKINLKAKATSLRYFNPVGAHITGQIGEIPANRPNNLVPIITQTAIGKIKEMSVYGDDYKTRDGSCIRDYVHVSDIADAHVKALKFLNEGMQDANYSLFNLGTGNGITVLEAISAFEKISKQKLNYKIARRRAGDVAAIYSDSSKALNLLKWKPKHSIESMMETAWKWEQYLLKEK